VANIVRSWLRSMTKASGLFAGALGAASLPAYAQTSWTGATSTDWFNGTNWNTATVPTAADIVAVDTVAPNATVIAGGPAVAAGTDIGNVAGSQGAVTVTGAGATWTNSGLLSVGTLGTGTLTIANGGVVSNGGASGFIAYANGSQGTVIVTGPGSTWNISPTFPNGGLRVGGSSLDDGFLPPGSGTGTLTVANGGTVNVIGGAQTVFVAEALLVFNEIGEVLNREGDVVGKLVCYLSNECGGF
jgi:T5SS/PEP-CTERM-associated repeat protein